MLVPPPLTFVTGTGDTSRRFKRASPSNAEHKLSPIGRRWCGRNSARGDRGSRRGAGEAEPSCARLEVECLRRAPKCASSPNIAAPLARKTTSLNCGPKTNTRRKSNEEIKMHEPTTSGASPKRRTPTQKQVAALVGARRRRARRTRDRAPPRAEPTREGEARPGEPLPSGSSSPARFATRSRTSTR